MSPGARDVDPRAHDVVEPGAGLGERALDDPEADPWPARRRRRAGRRRPGMIGAVPDTHTDSPDADGARVADAVLERGAGGDELPVHAG